MSLRYSPLKPVATPAAPPASSPVVKKINLAGFTKKKESSNGSEYPVFPDPLGKAAEAANEILRMTQEFESLEGALKSNKKFLVEITAPFHFQNSSGKADPAKAVLVEAGRRQPDGSMKMTGTRVRIDFKNSYPVLEDESALVPLLGDNVGACFRQKFSLTIDGEKLPADKAQDLLAYLQRLFAEFNASDALTVNSGLAPVEDFHIKRHSLLTPEQNLELQKLCPIRAAVATKNVK